MSWPVSGSPCWGGAFVVENVRANKIPQQTHDTLQNAWVKPREFSCRYRCLECLGERWSTSFQKQDKERRNYNMKKRRRKEKKGGCGDNMTDFFFVFQFWERYIFT